jgi:hypothetical protein
MLSDPPLLMPWSESALLWIIVSILALYLARAPAHDLIDRLCQVLADILRLGSAALLTLSRRIAVRNRQILRSTAEDESARSIERQFRRIGDRLDRDLGGYPPLHRALSEQVSRIDADHRQAADTPPVPPAWLAAIRAVATVDANGDPAVAAILRDMHGTLEASCHNALLEYRIANRRRYRGLRRMQPYFRRIASTLELLQQRLERVELHARMIDAHMSSYEALRTRRRGPVRSLAFDTPIRVIGGLALLVAAGLAAILNHRLIAEPLNALVGAAGTDAGPAWAASAILMLVELGLGLWIAETIGLTRLLGLLGHLDDRLRHRLVWIGAVLLGSLALLQAGLAWSAHMAASAPALPGPEWLTPAAAALLGMTLAFVLALAAIPLEAVVRSGRILLGALLAGAARVTAIVLRLAATAVQALPAALRALYDLWIFLPLWCEQAVRAARGRTHAPAELAPKRTEAVDKR